MKSSGAVMKGPVERDELARHCAQGLRRLIEAALSIAT
jgi:hypothetical protein